jgi:conjugal transfer/entry exclusion protein
MEGLNEALEMYANMTQNLIKALENEDYGNLKYLADEREKTIEYIKTLKYSNDEFRKICKRLQIAECQQALDRTAALKRSELRKDMDNFKRAKTAGRTYSKSLHDNYGSLNKKV